MQDRDVAGGHAQVPPLDGVQREHAVSHPVIRLDRQHAVAIHGEPVRRQQTCGVIVRRSNYGQFAQVYSGCGRFEQGRQESSDVTECR